MLTRGPRGFGYGSTSSLQRKRHVGLQQRGGTTESLALSSTTRELGPGEVPREILDFIERELEVAAVFDELDPAVNPDAVAMAEEWFLSTLDQWGS